LKTTLRADDRSLRLRGALALGFAKPAPVLVPSVLAVTAGDVTPVMLMVVVPGVAVASRLRVAEAPAASLMASA
jgi:hypothetical protein